MASGKQLHAWRRCQGSHIGTTKQVILCYDAPHCASVHVGSSHICQTHTCLLAVKDPAVVQVCAQRSKAARVTYLYISTCDIEEPIPGLRPGVQTSDNQCTWKKGMVRGRHVHSGLIQNTNRYNKTAADSHCPPEQVALLQAQHQSHSGPTCCSWLA